MEEDASTEELGNDGEDILSLGCTRAALRAWE